MSNGKEEKQEQPQIIIINTKEQVKNLIEAGKIAEKTTRYDRRKPNNTLIFFNGGKNQTMNPTLTEYLFRAERKIVNEMMSEIIGEASNMIHEELTNIKELLK